MLLGKDTRHADADKQEHQQSDRVDAMTDDLPISFMVIVDKRCLCLCLLLPPERLLRVGQMLRLPLLLKILHPRAVQGSLVRLPRLQPVEIPLLCPQPDQVKDLTVRPRVGLVLVGQVVALCHGGYLLVGSRHLLEQLLVKRPAGQRPPVALVDLEHVVVRVDDLAIDIIVSRQVGEREQQDTAHADQKHDPGQLAAEYLLHLIAIYCTKIIHVHTPPQTAPDKTSPDPPSPRPISPDR